MSEQALDPFWPELQLGRRVVPCEALLMIQITSDIQLDEGDIEERFVRASGPGGQNVNKVSTAESLRGRAEED